MTAEPTQILLVEDSPDDVELILRALRAHNLTNRVKVVSDGAEALDYLRPDDPDHVPPDGLPRLILLDLKLPRVGGVEVLRQLKASARTRTIPVVVLTSSREESDLVASYEYGANSYIVKPMDFEQFMEAVRQLGLYWMLLNAVPG
jgi:CheY-like chemotaxis protein